MAKPPTRGSPGSARRAPTLIWGFGQARRPATTRRERFLLQSARFDEGAGVAGSMRGDMSTSAAISNFDVRNSVSVAVAKKALDGQRAQGDMVAQLIKDAGSAGQQAQRTAAAAARGGIDVVG